LLVGDAGKNATWQPRTKSKRMLCNDKVKLKKQITGQKLNKIWHDIID